jgi:hypothetical protein
MKHVILFICLTVVTACILAQPEHEEAQNTLTPEEEAAGWKLLFDGQSSSGWRLIGKDHFPEKGWKVKDGLLCATDQSGSGLSGDIITEKQYGQFEFVIEWKMLTKGGNSGIKYFVIECLSKGESDGLGLEYQILDDENFPWMQQGKMNPNDFHSLGALYEFFPPNGDKKVVKPVGEWNSSRIVSRGRHVEHWLNGEKLVEYERGGKEFMEKLTQSKFRDIENFGQEDQGHILLQDHGSLMQFRNIKIREF